MLTGHPLDGAAASPVAVFCAAAPIAFSVAGGDTAAALAAGCPVIVKAHHSHPGTAELVGQAVSAAVKECGLPEGTFSLLYGPGREIGQALVQHPSIKAAGFTGSRAGGQALMKLAADRPEPIPFYAEMSSINPVFILPEALAKRGEALATGLYGSLTLGVGQFCTNPGLTSLQRCSLELFVASWPNWWAVAGATMLNPGIARPTIRREHAGGIMPWTPLPRRIWQGPMSGARGTVSHHSGCVSCGGHLVLSCWAVNVGGDS